MHDHMDSKHIRFFLRLIYTALIILACALAFRYVIPWFMPFLIALFIARILKNPVKILSRRLRLPHKVTSAILVVLFYAVIGTALWFLLAYIFDEIKKFVTELPELISQIPDVTAGIRDSIARLLERLPDDVTDYIVNFLDNVFRDLTIPPTAITSLVTTVTNFAFSLPSVMIFLITTLLSTYFITGDYDLVMAFIVAQIPERARGSMSMLRTHLVSTLGRWGRALGIILLITFAELFIGFLIIGYDYAALLALSIAFIDALPVLGVGTVLVPWGTYLLIIGDWSGAVSIGILYGVITVVRNLIEPKIVGKNIGLHPFVTLLSIYLGYKLMGVAGMFLFPLVIIILDKLQEWGFVRIWKTVPGEPAESLLPDAPADEGVSEIDTTPGAGTAGEPEAADEVRGDVNE